MTGFVAAIYRHPIKGFTPERLDRVELAAGACFPFDRLYVVEDGPSGFDPAAPKWVSKQRFTVLAKIPKVAQIRTRMGDDGRLVAEAPGAPAFADDLSTPGGRATFERWLAAFLGEEARGPLRVLSAPGAHRFMDHPAGHVSIINLASVRDLEAKLGRPIDPLRFRANLYVEGWPAWAENGWAGRRMMAGWARLEGYQPIVRCAAIEVDPATGERDIELVKALFEFYGHMNCGLYVQVAAGGAVAVGDAIPAPEAASATEHSA